MIEGMIKPRTSPIIKPELPIIKVKDPTKVNNWIEDNPQALIIRKSRSYLDKNQEIEWKILIRAMI